MKFGEKVKQLRSNANLTQPELAAKANIEQSYLSKLENEKSSPSFDVIEKITNALNYETMAFIESLDSEYIRDNLAHLPEIAKKYTEMRIAKRLKLKGRYIIASLMIVFGIALAFIGGSKIIFPDRVYEYQSMGIINKNETLKQFISSPIRIIDEDTTEYKKRLRDNRERIDERYQLTHDYKGEYFIENISAEKRRVYNLRSSAKHYSNSNDVLIVLGGILIVGGGFAMNYVYQFKD